MKEMKKLANAFDLMSGIPGVEEGVTFQLSVEEGNLLLEQVVKERRRWHVVETYKIPLCNILKTEMKTVQKIIEEEKNPMGRAMLGDALFGEKGMFLGALSGSGTKQKVVNRSYYIIYYFPESASEELQYIMFSADSTAMTLAYYEALQFEKLLEQHLRVREPSPMVKRMLQAVEEADRARRGSDGSITL